MSARLLLITSDAAMAKAVRTAIDGAMSLMEVDSLREEGLGETYLPSVILVDSDVRSGAQTAFERISALKRQFPATPVIVFGNEMSAQLVLVALRAGAQDFVDRDAGAEQIRLAIRGCLDKTADASHLPRAKIAGVLSPLSCELDQDFALNLAVRIAKRLLGDMTLYIDLSVPATQAGVALGIKAEFGVPDAIREVARVDKALLESALAREPRSGLYVMPLCVDFGSDAPLLEASSFSALLQVLRSFCGAIVIHYGPFSRQRALLEMVQPAAHFFVCCNQRFPAIRGASDLLHWFSSNGLGVPAVVVHNLAPGHTPSPADIRAALKIAHSIDLDASWDELAEAANGANPLALSETHYSRGLDACLAAMGIAPEPEPDLSARLRSWLGLGTAAEAS